MHTELKSGINWVGYVDWSVRDFHSFDTRHGATYNSYLVQDEKIALIDTVKGGYAPQLLTNVRELVSPDRVDYVICNHAEADHAGAMPAVIKALPNATLVCNAKCRDILAGYFDISAWKIKILTPGETLRLGRRTLHFLDTPMVHWPDSMVTYIPEEKLLFSNDAFGQHLASSVRFDDQWNLHDILLEAKSYYANIVAPYSRQVLKTLEAASQLDIQMIAPSHGLIWRKNLPAILEAYFAWASGHCVPKIVVLFDSMWESTAQMADSILAGANAVSQAVNVQLLHARRNTLTRIATEMLDASAVAFGSATLNGQMMPAMASALTYIKGLYRCVKKPAFAFGSSGWSIGGGEQNAKGFEEMNWGHVDEKARASWRATQDVHQACFNAGRRLARKAMEQ
ncbi:MAG: FprA family A-type flavoprotein [Planctomycetaceae bacterium]|nr:FprA family A-type flavoprotein [Planctomycetaceae bacterium]